MKKLLAGLAIISSYILNTIAFANTVTIDEIIEYVSPSIIIGLILLWAFLGIVFAISKMFENKRFLKMYILIPLSIVICFSCFYMIRYKIVLPLQDIKREEAFVQEMKQLLDSEKEYDGNEIINVLNVAFSKYFQRRPTNVKRYNVVTNVKLDFKNTTLDSQIKYYNSTIKNISGIRVNEVSKEMTKDIILENDSINKSHYYISFDGYEKTKFYYIFNITIYNYNPN